MWVVTRTASYTHRRCSRLFQRDSSFGTCGLRLAIGIVLVMASVTAAADPSTVASNTASAAATEIVDDYVGQLETLEAKIRLRRESHPDEPIAEEVLRQVELLKWLKLLQANCAVAEERKSELQANLLELQADRASAANDLSVEGQESFLVLDELRDQHEGESQHCKSIELELEAMKASLSSARERLETVNRERRFAREVLELNTVPAQQEDLARAYHVAKLTARVLQESVRQQRLELEVKTLELQIGKLKLTMLDRQLGSFRDNVRFSDEDLAAKIQLIDQLELETKEQIDTMTAALRVAEQGWLKAHESQTREPNATATEATAAWDFLRGARQEQLSLMNRLLLQAGIVRECWRRRHGIANDVVSPIDLVKWNDGVPIIQGELHRLVELVETRADERLGQLATLRKRMSGLPASDGVTKSLIEMQAHEAEQAIDRYRGHLVLLKMAERVIGRYAEEVSEAVEPDSVTDWLAQANVAANSIWNYEITSVDDRAITISKIVRGLLLFLIGQFVARYSSRFLSRRVLSRVGMSQGAISATQNIVFYLLLICCVFIALEIINLPLTVFAFMGGAIAIGIGFGSQNVLNNFISGLILLAESPVRVGDLVDIQGLQGTIEHIGARSTRVKTGANIEIIVPNSSLLENNVTNWTLSDTRIRTSVSVGVAYGSPVDEVVSLLKRTVLEHTQVLQTPEPIILFKEFGDNALNFEAHFWIHMRRLMDRERVNSDIRIAAERAFDVAGITIAFPQRDIHLDTVRPIEVNLRTTADARKPSPFDKAA